MDLPFALSPSHVISNVGSDAGFAALIGLAILVLLYFAHAREAKTLREQLSVALQRVEALERRPMSGALSTPVPVARPPIATPAAASRMATSAPAEAPSTSSPVAAPAGVGAPALIDATRVVPAFEQVLGDAEPSDGHEDPVPVRAFSAPGGTGTVAPPPPVAPPPTEAGRVGPVAGKTPAPVTAAAGGNGSAPGGNAQSLTPGSLLREGLPGARRRHSLRVLVPVAVAAAAVVVAIVVVLLLTSGGSTPKSTARHHTAASQMVLALRKVVPSSVTVAVLNATMVNQLAHHTAQRLIGKGFKQGQLATASNQSLKTTTVGYLPGHRLDALAVAHALKLTAAAVAPVQAASKALACPGTAPCTADVVVTVGADLAPAA